MQTTTEEQTGIQEAVSSSDARRRALFIALGIVLVSQSYPDTGLAKLPMQYLLKDQLALAPPVMALFLTIANIPSWCKPVIGIVSDSVPLFGTRRRYYVMLAATLGVFLWVLMAFVPQQFAPLLGVAVCLNAMATIGGTINGAVIVEEGQRQGATGRLVSIRNFCMSAGSIAAGPIGGWLASKAFGWTCAAGAFLMGSLALLALYSLREPRTALRNNEVWPTTRRHLISLAHSKPLWIAGILVFLNTVAPGFGTALFFHQTNRLEFPKYLIGYLSAVSSICSVLGAFCYYNLCKRMNLRVLLFGCTAFHAAAAFTYVWYLTVPSAYIIGGLNGFAGTLGFLVLFDLAARATPKGSEAMGYSILYSFVNIAMGVSDMTGSGLFELFHRHFTPLVWINSGTTALILLGIPFLPAALVNRKDGDKIP